MRSSTVTEKPKERTRMRRAVAVGVSALAIATLSVGLSAQEADDLLGPFTPEELDEQLVAGPQEPHVGALSLSRSRAATTWPGSGSTVLRRIP